jgi:hypothetical protein
MPKKDGTGPSRNASGPRDGHGEGKGKNATNGTGEKKGGKKGNC